MIAVLLSTNKLDTTDTPFDFIVDVIPDSFSTGPHTGVWCSDEESNEGCDRLLSLVGVPSSPRGCRQNKQT